MKKAFSLLAAVVLLLAAGCEKQTQKKTDETVIPKAFSSTLEVSYGELSMTAEYVQTSFGNGKIRMLTPEILKPLEMTFVDEKCEVVYDSLQFESAPDRFPQAKFGSVLVQTLAYIGTGIDIEKTGNGNTICYGGSCEYGTFTLKQNSKSGNLTEITVEAMDLHVKFTQFETE